MQWRALPAQPRCAARTLPALAMLCCGRRKENLEAGGSPGVGVGASGAGAGAGQGAGAGAYRNHTAHQPRPQPVLHPDFRKVSGVSSEIFRQIETVEKDVGEGGNEALAACERRGEMVVRVVTPAQLGRRSAEAAKQLVARAQLESNRPVHLVEIVKRPGQTLGLYIREGDGVTRTDGVFISRIALESPVYSSGCLRVGDEILAVNLVDVRHMSLDDVVIIMSIPRRLLLATSTTHGGQPGGVNLEGRLDSTNKPPPVVVLKRECRDRDDDVTGESTWGRRGDGDLVSEPTWGGRGSDSGEMSWGRRGGGDGREERAPRPMAAASPLYEGYRPPPPPHPVTAQPTLNRRQIVPRSGSEHQLPLTRHTQLRNSLRRTPLYGSRYLNTQPTGGTTGTGVSSYEGYMSTYGTLSGGAWSRWGEGARRRGRSLDYSSDSETARSPYGWRAPPLPPAALPPPSPLLDLATKFNSLPRDIRNSTLSRSGMTGLRRGIGGALGERARLPTHYSAENIVEALGGSLGGTLSGALGSSLGGRGLGLGTRSLSSQHLPPPPSLSLSSHHLAALASHSLSHSSLAAAPYRPAHDLTLPSDWSKYKNSSGVSGSISGSAAGGRVSGLLWLQVVGARGLRGPGVGPQGAGSGARDLYCVVECDRVHRARTVVRAWCGGHVDWDEAFELEAVESAHLELLLYSWDPQLRHKLTHRAHLALAELSPPDHSHHLPLRLEPRGTLVVRARLTPPRVLYRRAPAPPHASPRALFGVPLEVAAAREVTPNPLPLIVRRCIEEVERRGLDIIGVYRLCGSASKKRALREAWERSARPPELAPDHVPDVNVITGLLKDYLRELPTPLLPLDVAEEMARGPAVSRSPPTLPASVRSPAHRATLHAVLDHLALVAAHNQTNKMTAHQLALALAPSTTMHAPHSLDYRRPVQALHTILLHWPPPRRQPITAPTPAPVRCGARGGRAYAWRADSTTLPPALSRRRAPASAAPEPACARLEAALGSGAQYPARAPCSEARARSPPARSPPSPSTSEDDHSPTDTVVAVPASLSPRTISLSPRMGPLSPHAAPLSPRSTPLSPRSTPLSPRSTPRATTNPFLQQYDAEEEARAAAAIIRRADLFPAVSEARITLN